MVKIRSCGTRLSSNTGSATYWLFNFGQVPLWKWDHSRLSYSSWLLRGSNLKTYFEISCKCQTYLLLSAIKFLTVGTVSDAVEHFDRKPFCPWYLNTHLFHPLGLKETMWYKICFVQINLCCDRLSYIFWDDWQHPWPLLTRCQYTPRPSCDYQKYLYILLNILCGSEIIHLPQKNH